jgi:pyruvate/2-oxoglutarate dehydrogenase complex dihydrolipoamide dehydrogenase (E3) component
MASWREGMPAGMLLKSARDASSISAPEPDASIVDFLMASGRPPIARHGRVSLDQFIDYGTWFEQRFVAGVHDDAMVVRLERNDTDFVIDLDSGGRLTAPNVVVAAGHRPHAYVPDELAALASETDLVTHSSAHSDLSMFSGRRVAVVGAGQSALETAVLLGECGAEPVLIVRRPAVDWDQPSVRETVFTEWLRPTTGLGRGWPKRMLENHAGLIGHLPVSARMELLRKVLGPAGSSWLHVRFDSQPVTQLLGHQVRSAATHRGGVRLLIDGGDTESALDVDHVIAATGYRFEVDRIAFLDPSVRAAVARVNGFPRLSRTFRSSVPGLYFTGLAAGATFGPLMRFVCGTRFAGPRLTSGVAHPARARNAVTRAVTSRDEAAAA